MCLNDEYIVQYTESCQCDKQELLDTMIKVWVGYIIYVYLILLERHSVRVK